MSHVRPVGFIGNPSDFWVSIVLGACARGRERAHTPVLFAEHPAAGRAPLRDTESYRAIACWSSAQPKYDELQQAICKEGISQLHILPALSTFAAARFEPLMRHLKTMGVELVIHLASDDLRDSASRSLLMGADRIIADSAAARHQAACYGLPLDRIVVAAGPAARPALSRAEARGLLGVPAAMNVVVAFSTRSAGEELREIIEASNQLRAAGKDLLLVILRADPAVSGGGKDYGFTPILPWDRPPPWVRVIQDRFPGNIDRFLAAADIVVFPPLRAIREVRSALAAAASSGAAILAPDCEPFSMQSMEGCLLRYSADLPLGTALTALFEREALATSLRDAAAQWSLAHGVEQYADAVLAPRGTERSSTSGAADLTAGTTMPTPKPGADRVAARTAAGRPKLLIAAFDCAQGGAAPAVADSLAAALRSTGLDTDRVDGIPDSVQGYDLVHLVIDGGSAELGTACDRCRAASVPFVVSPLYGGWKARMSAIAVSCGALERYIAKGQPKARWSEMQQGAPSARVRQVDLAAVLGETAACMPFGEGEAALLKRDLQRELSGKACEPILLGTAATTGDGGAAFTAAHGVRDYILCCGSFGWMGNQLGLLRAVEESDLPLVLLGRGAGSDPAYLEACKWFARKGPTLVLDDATPSMRASAIAGARVVVSPSWFALPSPELLSAAALGRNVVMSDCGNGREYFGDGAYYADSGDPEALHTAILAAYYAPVRPELAARAADATIDRAATRLIEAYRSTLKLRADLSWPNVPQAVAAAATNSPAPAPLKLELESEGPSSTELVSESLEMASLHARDATHSVERIPAVVGTEPPPKPLFTIPSVQLGAEVVRDDGMKALCDEGDRHAREGNADEARNVYERAVAMYPRSSRPHRSLGVLSLQLKRYDDAERGFRRATELDPSDSKAIVGLGAVAWAREDVEAAFKHYVEAIEIDPSDKTPIYYLVQAGYSSNRLGELEQALRKSLQFDADNQYIQYCLAGCYYKQNRKVLAKSVVERILRKHPDDEAAKELLDKMLQDEADAANVRNESTPRQEALSLPAAAQNPRMRAAFDEVQARIENAKRGRQYDSVLTLCDRMEELPGVTEDDRAYVAIVRGEICACRNEVDKAEEYFITGKANESWCYRAICGLGALEASRGNWNAAETMFERSLELKPEYDVALAGLGVCAVEKGQQELAWRMFRQALTKNPGNLRAMYGALQVGYALGYVDEMAVCLESYLDEHPADLGMLYSYAGCLYALGRNSEAEMELGKILLLDPTHALARELSEKLSASKRRVAAAGS